MRLYGYRNGRTFRAAWALEEVGAQYEYVEVDLMRGEGREQKFLEINPAGKVPVLEDGGTIITESAAICMHLAEKYPQSRLMPPAGTLERSQCYKWTSYIITELDAPLWTIAKHRFALPRERRVPAVIETAGWEFRLAVKVLATGLGDRPYLPGWRLPDGCRHCCRPHAVMGEKRKARAGKRPVGALSRLPFSSRCGQTRTRSRKRTGWDTP